TVELNLGNGIFAGPGAGGGGLVSSGHNVGLSVSGGFDVPNGGIVGGGGTASSGIRASGTHMSLLDINGDGLVDLVGPGDGAVFLVRLNTGAGFTEEATWEPAQTWEWFSNGQQEIGEAAEAAHDANVSADVTANGHITTPIAFCGPVPC